MSSLVKFFDNGTIDDSAYQEWKKQDQKKTLELKEDLKKFREFATDFKNKVTIFSNHVVETMDRVYKH